MNKLILTLVLLSGFSATLNAAECSRLWRHPQISRDSAKAETPAEKQRLEFGIKIQKLLSKQKWDEIYKLFHPALQKQMRKKRFRIRMENLVKTYGKRPQVSNFRSWLIAGTSGDPEPIWCDKSNLHVFPSYGFSYQLSLWFQILGDEDVGRYFIQAAVKDGQWKILLVHVHQWTHLGTDGPTWVNRGLSEKDSALKYLYLDLGFKLAMSNPHIVWPGREALKQDVLDAKAKAKLEIRLASETPKNIRDVSSAFNRKGLGLTVYLEFDKETSKNERKKSCNMFSSKLAERSETNKTKTDADFWLTQAKGVQCIFMYPRHTELKPNKLGTYRSSIKIRKAKKDKQKKEPLK